MNGIILTGVTDRKLAIRQSRPERTTSLRLVAERLSRRNADVAVVELFNEALARLTELVYEADADGYLANVDAPTGKVLVCLPWGKAGHVRWGLRATEANALRRVLFARRRGPAVPLFVYERLRRCWRVNLADYPTAGDAWGYLQGYPVTVGEYRAARAK